MDTSWDSRSRSRMLKLLHSRPQTHLCKAGKIPVVVPMQIVSRKMWELLQLQLQLHRVPHYARFQSSERAILA